MSDFDAKKIEEYQVVLLKNPRSKVFAALAEVYRKMGLLEEALETAQRGVAYNPNYVSGLVAHAKILYEMKLYRDAIPLLNKATELKPENLLARRLLAHCHIKLKNHLEALKAYKSLLFYNPSDEKAAHYVKKWEFLQGAEFQVDEPLIDPEIMVEWVNSLPSPADLLNVIDVYITKNDFATVSRLILIGLEKWPEDSEIERRKKVIQKKMPKDPILSVRREFWEKVLHRIEKIKKIDPLLGV